MRRVSTDTIVDSSSDSDQEDDVSQSKQGDNGSSGSCDIGIVVRDDAQIHPDQDVVSSSRGLVVNVETTRSSTVRRRDDLKGLLRGEGEDSTYRALFQEESKGSAESKAKQHDGEALLSVETLKPVQVRNAGIVWLCYTFFATLNFIFVAMAVVDWSSATEDLDWNTTQLPDSEFSKAFYEFFVGFHLIANTLAYAMLFFLLIAFPLAMIKLCIRKTVLVPEQLMVLSLIIILNVSPGTNLYSLYCTWIAALDFFESGRNFTSALLNLEENFYFRSLECLASHDASLDGYAEYHRILSVISVAFIGFFEAITCQLAATGNEDLPVDREPSRFQLCIHSCKVTVERIRITSISFVTAYSGTSHGTEPMYSFSIHGLRRIQHHYRSVV